MFFSKSQTGQERGELSSNRTHRKKQNITVFLFSEDYFLYSDSFWLLACLILFTWFCRHKHQNENVFRFTCCVGRVSFRHRPVIPVRNLAHIHVTWTQHDTFSRNMQTKNKLKGAVHSKVNIQSLPTCLHGESPKQLETTYGPHISHEAKCVSMNVRTH